MICRYKQCGFPVERGTYVLHQQAESAIVDPNPAYCEYFKRLEKGGLSVTILSEIHRALAFFGVPKMRTIKRHVFYPEATAVESVVCTADRHAS